MKTETALNIILDFEKRFYKKLGDYSLEELADSLDIDLESTGDFNELVARIKTCFFADLMYDDEFQELPVLACFSYRDAMYFAIELLDTCFCLPCGEECHVYRVISLSDSHYGITTIVGCESILLEEYPYKTVRDVVTYLEDNTDLMEASCIIYP